MQIIIIQLEIMTLFVQVGIYFLKFPHFADEIVFLLSKRSQPISRVMNLDTSIRRFISPVQQGQRAFCPCPL